MKEINTIIHALLSKYPNITIGIEEKDGSIFRISDCEFGLVAFENMEGVEIKKTLILKRKIHPIQTNFKINK